MNETLLPILRCPACGGTLSLQAGGDAALMCANCGKSYPIVDGIPRFVGELEDGTAARTQASFGYEWTHFNDWSPSGETNFNDYFEGVDFGALRDATVLDGGCGMGRHARQIAPHVKRVVAVDFSRAIDQAARNTGEAGNVDCVQGDLLALPLADESFDFVYSLGVLHHIDQTEAGLKALVGKVRPGGSLRVYLYWRRHGWKGQLLKLATAGRRLTTRMPFPALRAFCRVLSVGLYGTVVLPYRALSAAGISAHQDWPLYVYSKYPFQVLYNDQFDRFSAPLEKRYDPDEVIRMMENAGLTDVTVQPCFGWVAQGTRPPIPSSP